MDSVTIIDDAEIVIQELASMNIGWFYFDANALRRGFCRCVIGDPIDCVSFNKLYSGDWQIMSDAKTTWVGMQVVAKIAQIALCNSEKFDG